MLSRITQNMMSRNFLANVYTTSKRMNDSNMKFSNHRAFSYMSESVTDGARAMRIRQQLYKNIQMQRNNSIVQEEFAVAETNMYTIGQMLIDAHAEAIRIQNGTFEQTERDIVANEFEGQMKNIFQYGNAIYGDHYVFAGTKNDIQPYNLNGYGELTYNGARVSDTNRLAEFAEFYVDPDTKQKYVGNWNDDKTEFTFQYNGATRVLSTSRYYTDSIGINHDLAVSGNPYNSADKADTNGYFFPTGGLQPGDINKLPVTTNYYYQKVDQYIQIADRNADGAVTGVNYYQLVRDSDGSYFYDSSGAVPPSSNANTTVRLDAEQVRNATTVSADQLENYNNGNYSRGTAGSYIRDTKTGFFYEINKDDPLQYTNEYGKRIDVPGKYYIQDGASGNFYELVRKSDGSYAYNNGSAATPNLVDISVEDIRNSLIVTDEPRYNVAEVPYSENTYVDVGLGMAFTTNNGLDRNTTVQTSVSGLAAFGYGTTKTTYVNMEGEKKEYELPNSIYLIFGEMAKALRENDVDKIAALDIHMVNKTAELNKQIADLGVRDKHLSANEERLVNEELTLKQLQGAVEGIEPAQVITEVEMNEAAWMMTLQFGSRFIPKSLMDYIR